MVPKYSSRHCSNFEVEPSVELTLLFVVASTSKLECLFQLLKKYVLLKTTYAIRYKQSCICLVLEGVDGLRAQVESQIWKCRQPHAFANASRYSRKLRRVMQFEKSACSHMVFPHIGTIIGHDFAKRLASLRSTLGV